MQGIDVMPPRDADPLSLFLGSGKDQMESIDRLIGKIEATQEAIKETLERHQSESREGRSKIYKEIEATNTTIADMRADFKELNIRLESVETKLTGFEKLRENVRGGVIVISIIWATIGGAIAIFWKWIIAKMGG